MLRTNPLAVALAFGHAAAIVILGYILLGLMPMLLFASGFIGGLLVWLVKPQTPSFAEIRAPYILTLVLFGLHKIEEREMDFFPALATMTGVAPPAEGPAGAIALYAPGIVTAAPLVAAAWWGIWRLGNAPGRPRIDA